MVPNPIRYFDAVQSAVQAVQTIDHHSLAFIVPSARCFSGYILTSTPLTSFNNRRRILPLGLLGIWRTKTRLPRSLRSLRISSMSRERGKKTRSPFVVRDFAFDVFPHFIAQPSQLVRDFGPSLLGRTEVHHPRVGRDDVGPREFGPLGGRVD